MAVHATAFYNTVLMEQAGLDPSAIPSTIAEFDEVVRAIAALGSDDQGNRIWGFTTATDRSELSANIFNHDLLDFGIHTEVGQLNGISAGGKISEAKA